MEQPWMVIGFIPVGLVPLLVLSSIGTAMVSRAGVRFAAGPAHPYWIEKVKLSKRAEPRCVVNPSVVRPVIHRNPSSASMKPG